MKPTFKISNDVKSPSKFCFRNFRFLTNYMNQDVYGADEDDSTSLKKAYKGHRKL